MTTTVPDRNFNPHRVAQNPAALYVGDLAESVTEKTLFELFNSIGPVSSVRIVRDSSRKKSMNYGYVNYHSHTDAANALNNINFFKLHNREIRVMWSNPDASVRRSGVGNIFVKNLDESIDNKTLYDTFSVFGNILSSKVAYDYDGKSLGYGFVHYENADSAEMAIRKVNKMEIVTKVVEVSHFISYKDRNNGEPKFTNLYVKNFTAEKFPNENAFKAFFEQYGKITSVYFPTNEKEQPRLFAFVNFADPEVAKTVIEKLHQAEPDKLYVTRALSKSMRRCNLHESYLRWREEIDRRTEGRNIYVKNLPDNVDDEQLLAEFEKFGKVERASVKKDLNKTSKGFGFVLFDSVDCAQAAIKGEHGKIWNGKVLFVAMWQRKNVRQQQMDLQNTYRKNFPQQQYNPMFTPASPLFYPQQLAGMPQNMGMMYAQQMSSIPPPGWNRMPRGMAAQPMLSPQIQPMRFPSQNHQEHPQMFMRGGMQSPVQQNLGGEHFDKSEVGDELYRRIHDIDPTNASKITGMFLEMEKDRLMKVLYDSDALYSHVAKAQQMLASNAQAEQQN